MAQQPPPLPPPPGYTVRRSERPGGATAAGALIIVVGAIFSLFGVLIVVFVLAARQLVSEIIAEAQGIEGAANAAVAVGIVIAMAFLALGVLDIVAGAKVLGLSAGWRIGGIVLTTLGTLLTLLGAISALREQRIDPQTLQLTSTPNIANLVVTLILVAMNVVALVLLARNGRAFVR